MSINLNLGDRQGDKMGLKEKGSLNISSELLEYFHSGGITVEIWMHPETGREEWQRHKGKVLADFFKTRPGSRPFAWWEYSSPDHPKNFKPINIDAVQMVERDYIRWGSTSRPGPETFPEPPYLFESEAAYLKRKKLLIRGELQRIKPQDFEPKETYPFFKVDRFGKFSRVNDYEKVLEKTRERIKEGGSLAISTFTGLPESQYPIRFKIYDS